MFPKRISYEEAKVRAVQLANRKTILELKRDGEVKFFEAEAAAQNGPACDEIRRRLHDLLDEYLDTAHEFITLAQIVEPPK